MVSNLTPKDTTGHFDVVKTAKASWLGLVVHHKALFKIARHAFLLSLLLSLFSTYYLGSFFGVILILSGIVPTVLFTVSWQRFILMNEVTQSLRKSLRWEGAHWRILGLLTTLFFFSSLFILFTTNIFSGTELTPAMSAAITALLIYYVTIRLLFMIPATAVGEKDYTVMESWSHTKGHATRIFCGFIVVNAPSLILLLIDKLSSDLLFNDHSLKQTIGENVTLSEEGAILSIEALIATLRQTFADHPLLYLVNTVINQTTQFILIAVNLSFIAYVFQQVTRWVPANSSQDNSGD